MAVYIIHINQLPCSESCIVMRVTGR